MPFLQLHATSIPSNLDVQIHVHVTREITQVIDFKTHVLVTERADSWTTLDTSRRSKRAKTENGKWSVTWGDKRRSLQLQEQQAFRASKQDAPVGILKKPEYSAPLAASLSNTPSEEDLFGRSYSPVTRIGQHFLNLPAVSPTASIRMPSPGSRQLSLLPPRISSKKARKVAFADMPNPTPPSMPPRRPSGYPGVSSSESDFSPSYSTSSPQKRKDPPQYYESHSDEDIPVLDFSEPMPFPVPQLDHKISSKSFGSAISLDSVYSDHSYDPAFVAGPYYTPPSASLGKFEPQPTGLDHLFRFHTGRADLKAVIEEARFEIRSGTLSVNVCGPGSLLRGVRHAVREVSTMKSAWRGEALIEFHSETFGW